MNVYAIMSLAAIVINVATGFYVLSRGPRLLLNRIFLIVMMTLAVWSTGEFIMRIAGTESMAVWGARVAALGWCFAGAAFVHFVLVLTERRRYLNNPVTYQLLYLPAAVLLILVWATELIFKGFEKVYWGFGELKGTLRLPSQIYVVIMMLIGIGLLFDYWFKCASPGKKSGAGYVLVAATIPIVAGIVSDIALPAAGIKVVELPMFATTIMGPIIGYAVIRYDLMTSIASSLGPTVISSMNEAVLVTDPGGVIQTVNPNAVELTGYSESELSGTPVDSLFVEYRRDSPLEESGEEAVTDAGRWCLLLTRMGNAIPVTRSTGTVRRSSGKEAGSVIVIHDMRDTLRLLQAEHEAEAATAAAQAERSRSEYLRRSREEIREQREFLQGIIDNIAEPVFIKGSDLRFIYVNNAFSGLLGYSKEDMLGKTDHDFFPEEEADDLKRTDMDVMNTGELVEIGEIGVREKGGTPRTVRVLKAPIKNERGEVEYLVGIVSDITEQKRLESARLDFIRIAAHELKTPITSLKLGFDLLARETEDTLDEEQRRSLDVLSLSIQRLSMLAKNLLDLASMDAGLLVLNRQEIAVPPLLDEAIAVFYGQLKEKGLDSRLEYEPDLEKVLADPNRISQVLFNLMSNAVKFTDRGDITLSARSLDDGFVEICVSDTGVGVSYTQREAVFGRFVKADSAERAKEGTGLGLSIARAIVEAHGGRIWLESASGIGSKFFFTVPKAG